MDRELVSIALVRIRALLELGDTQEAGRVLMALLPADQADLFRELGAEEREGLLALLDPEQSADVLEQMDDDAVLELVTDLPPTELAPILDEMEPDMAADLLGDLEPAATEAALAEMEAPEEVRSLLQYPDDTAGGLMTSQYYAYPLSARVGEVFDAIRAEPLEDEEIPYVYALGEGGQLEGVARLADLIRAHPQQLLGNIVRPAEASISAVEDRESVVELINRYHLVAVPVLDDAQRLIGVITADDAMTAQDQEASEDIYVGAGIISLAGQEAARSDLLLRGPLWRVWLVRVPFLFVTLLGAMLAGSVIGAFKEALGAVLALAFFVPVVMGMGGNVGAQSGEVFIRANALGQIDRHRFFAHLLKEATVGLGLGLLVGVPAGLIALFWQGIPELGLVVSLSMVVTATLASVIGFLAPYLLLRIGADPAAGSSPFVTTLKDIIGLLVYFTLATALMGQLL